ncbi:MAG: TVP38/TMEM64 family protein [Nitrospirota bacterium]|nr:TVP38/TMEM64 family protein [Nitrospirota bacterium]
MKPTRLIVLAIVALLVALFFLLDLDRHLSLEALKANRDALFAAYEANRAVFLLTYVLIYIAVVALSLPGGAVMTLAGGAIFGALAGTGAVLVGATIGAVLAFLLARYLFRDTVEKRLGPRLEKLSEGFANDGLGYLLFLRLVPLFPFFLINLGAGLTKLPLRTYFLGTALGIAPGTFVFANAGANLARINTVRDIVSPGVLGAFALLGLFALVPTVVQKMRAKKKAAGG